MLKIIELLLDLIATPRYRKYEQKNYDFLLIMDSNSRVYKNF